MLIAGGGPRTTLDPYLMTTVPWQTGMQKKQSHSKLFFASVFNANDRPWAVRSSQLEDHGCGNSDFPFADTEIGRGQPYPSNVPKSTGPWWRSSQSTEGASGCYGRTPLNHLSKVL